MDDTGLMNRVLFCLETRQTRRRRGTVLQTEQDIAAALDVVDSETEELLSRAGSIEDLSRWIDGELQLGKKACVIDINY
jgi:hypothetical protein